MNTKTFATTLVILGLLIPCAQVNSQPVDIIQTVHDVKTSDHMALAKYYEDQAREMQAKVQEHKKMLEKYQAESQHYGRRGLDMETMCKGLIRAYEQAETENMSMADAHRQMAEEPSK
ncbi:hypothetical protein [Nitrosomonas ureae]|jgi:hypothetical protein|uniref:Uncharacterized protein n=1 Tax=Nitrosomonas ureae TaxID=44577 RepID=A0A286ALP1_9PROT|nr:hypothetical protein [Nitrosomonas ureae]SOD22821.1 hypothetical protein SAMN06297164_3600 [Nitrosomonas ureae]